MAEVNEELLKKYFETQGYLVITNKRYMVKGDKGGVGYADIDLIILHPISNYKAIVQVKGWHTMIFTKKYCISEKRIFNFLSAESLLCAKEFFGTPHFKKILVVSTLPSKKQSKKEW